MMSMMTMTMNNNDHDDDDEVYIHSKKRTHNNSDGFIELQQKSSAEPLLSEAPMVLLQMPKEWFDLNKRLPTDKEFHQWIRQQIQHEKMQRRRGRRHRHHYHFDDNDEEQKSNSFDDDGSSNSTTNPPPPPPHQEVLSAVGDAIKEASENLLEGIKIIQQEQQSRKEYNDIMKYNPHDDDDDDVNLLLLGERPGFAINNFESDCFPSLGKNNGNKRRESVVVGMELPVMS